MGSSVDASNTPVPTGPLDVASAEALLAEATRKRDEAAREGRAIVRAAQSQAEALLAEARAEQAAALSAAQTKARSVVDQARAAAVDTVVGARREVRAVEAERAQATGDASAASRVADNHLADVRAELAEEATRRRAAYAAALAEGRREVELLLTALRGPAVVDMPELTAARARLQELGGGVVARTAVPVKARPLPEVGPGAPARPARPVRTDVPDRARQPRRKRAPLPGRTATLFALAFGVFGLALVGTGHALAWQGFGAPAVPLWYAGLIVIAISMSWGALRPGMSTRARAALSVGLAELIYLSWFLSSPVLSDRFDESLHVRTLLDLIERGGLFQPNGLLPVSPFFPGLELATSGVHWLTGLPLLACQVIVVLTARAVLGLSLFWIARRLTGSARSAGVVVLLYGASPQFYYYNSQFAYQTVALGMMLAVLVFLGRACDSEKRWPWRELLGATACAAAVALAHHLTSWIAVAALVVLAVLFRIGGDRRRARLTATVAGLAGLVVAVWSAIAGPTLFTYLSGIFGAAAMDMIAILSGDGAQHAPGSGAGGEPTPLYEMAIMAGSILVWLAMLAPACWWAWRRRSIGTSFSRYLPLFFAAAYPGLHLTRFASKAAEIGDRFSTFLFLALVLVVGAWLAGVTLRSRLVARLAIPAVVLLIIGGTLLGSGPQKLRSPGDFVAAGDWRSVDATTIAVSRWLAERVPAGSVVAADNTFNGFLPTYADVQMDVRPGGFRGVVEVFLADAMGPWQRQVLHDDKVDFLIADYRQVDVKPFSGSLFEGSDSYPDGTHLSAAQLDKFADEPGFDLILDGPVKVYDLRPFQGKAQTFEHRDIPAVPGGLDWRQPVGVGFAALLCGLWVGVRRQRVTVSLPRFLLVIPALMGIGLCGVLTGMSPFVGAAVAVAGLAAVAHRAVPVERTRERWPTSDLLIVGVAATLLVTVVAADAVSAADRLFDTPVALHATGAAR